jgi:hypothetical protein
MNPIGSGTAPMRPEAESKQGSRQEKWRERSSRTTIEFIVIHSQQTSKLAQAPGQNSIGTGGQYWIGVNIETGYSQSKVVFNYPRLAFRKLSFED